MLKQQVSQYKIVENKNSLRVNIQDGIRKEIRKQFDDSLLQEPKLAAIEVAREYGFDDLAKEMQADYNEDISQAKQIIGA